MSATKSPLLVLALLLTVIGCDEPESDDDPEQVDWSDVISGGGQEPPPEEESPPDFCDILGCRVTSEEIGAVLGLGEADAAILLDEAGHQPQVIGGQLRYLIDDNALAFLAARS